MAEPLDGPDGRAWSGPVGIVVRVAVVVIAAAPAVAATVSVLGMHWFPGGDQAVEVMRATDVGGPHTPLVGSWSRWGWSHPGPLLFWVLAPLEHLAGNDGVLLTCGLLATAAAASIALIGLRRGGAALGAMLAVAVVVLCASLGLDTLIDPWNPYVALLPFLVYVLSVWSTVCGDVVMAPVAAVVGTFCVQAHLGFLPLVAGLAVFALLVLVARHLGEARTRRRRGAAAADRGAGPGTGTGTGRAPRTGTVVAVSGFLLAVLWLPVLIDQVGGTGNLTTLWDYVRAPQEATVGWPYALALMSAQLRLPTPWMGAQALDAFNAVVTDGDAWVLGATLVIAGCIVWALHRRRSDLALLDAVALTCIGLGVASTARVTGVVPPYLTYRTWIVSLVAYVAVAWTLLATTGPRCRRIAAVLLLGVASVLAARTIHDEHPVKPPLSPVSTSLSHLVRPTAERLDPSRTYSIHTVDVRDLGAAGPGLLLALRQQGLHVFAEPSELADIQFGAQRVRRPAATDGVLTIVGLDSIGAGWTPPAGSTELARHDPLSPAERRRFAELQRSVAARLGDAPVGGIESLDTPFRRGLAVAVGIPSGDVTALRELQARGSGFAVFLSPPPARPAALPAG